MKKYILFLAMVMAFGAYAQEWHPSYEGSRIIVDSISSNTLGLKRAYTVYLPNGYDPAKRYPVLYLLHGLGGGNIDWNNDGKLSKVADRLVASGEMVPTVIVMPDGGERNSPGKFGYFDITNWPFEQFFFNEFIPEIESRYNAGGTKDMRAIAGLSMGGGGATAYAQHHPEMFNSVYAMSALMDLPDGRDVNSDNSLYNSAVKANSCISFVNNADDSTLDSLRGIVWFIDCGDDDFLLDRNLEFYKAMRMAGVPAQLRVRDGGHDWEYWHSALYTALPFVSRNFAR